MKRDTGFLYALIQSLKKFINNTYLRLDAANDPMQANLDMGNYELNNVDAVAFNLTPGYTPAEGVFGWNAEAGTVQVGMPGGNVNLQIGQEILIRVKASEDISNGELIYVDGASGVNPTVSLAQADNLFESNGTLAMATEDISSGQLGYVTTFGLVRDLNTNSCNAGDILYLDATTPGAWTNVKPTDPNYPVRVGYCLRKSLTEGIILTNILQNTWETVVNQGYLAIDGSNANQNINIGGYDFSAATHTITGGTQDYMLGATGTVGYIQSMAPGTLSFFGFFSNDGDKTDNVGWAVYGQGTPASLNPSERMQGIWNAATSQYEITTEKVGVGVYRAIMVDASGGSFQFKLDTDGSVQFGYDNQKVYWGLSQDAYFMFDATNFLVDPGGEFRYVSQPTFTNDEQIATKKYVDDSVASPIYAVTEIDHTDSPYTALLTDYLIVADTSGGDVEIDLPAISGNLGKPYIANNTGSGVLTVDANGTETINGELTQDVGEDEAMFIIATSAEWRIV